MADYYNSDEYLEAVLFLFVKDGKMLVELRPKKDHIETFIPNGRIDTEDFNKDEDYKIVAMKREISEEFSNQVKISNYIPLGIFKVEQLKFKFFGYLITRWDGEVPDYTIEGGEKFADLKWIPLKEHKEHLKLPSALFFVEEAIKKL